MTSSRRRHMQHRVFDPAQMALGRRRSEESATHRPAYTHSSSQPLKALVRTIRPRRFQLIKHVTGQNRHSSCSQLSPDGKRAKRRWSALKRVGPEDDLLHRRSHRHLRIDLCATIYPPSSRTDGSFILSSRSLTTFFLLRHLRAVLLLTDARLLTYSHRQQDAGHAGLTRAHGVPSSRSHL